VQKQLLTPLGPLVSSLMNERMFRKGLCAVFGSHTRPTEEELHRFWLLVAHDGGARLAHRLISYIPERRANRDRWVGVLARTSVPLLLIDGAADPVSGLHMVERYRELVPDPRAVVLPGIGHYPQIEDPRRTLLALLEFHDQLARQGGTPP
jgi:pimeloyl-ACP methyl ester carboxylesterase